MSSDSGAAPERRGVVLGAHVELTGITPERRKGRARITVGGADISESVAEIEVHAVAGPNVPMVILHVPLARLTVSGVPVRVSGRTRRALLALGWTEPGSRVTPDA